MSAIDRVIPKPLRVQSGAGSFRIDDDTSICAAEPARAAAEQLARFLTPAMGRLLEVQSVPKQNSISLTIDAALSNLGGEGYQVKVDTGGVQISARAPAGLVWGVQTLRHLLPVEIFSPTRVDAVSWEVPCIEIEDWPRFGWRGLMLDCARHFMPIEFIYKWIDLLSLHKLNVFHWHLTEDQGWRIEIKKYPKLTEIGAWRKETLVGHARAKDHSFDGKRHGGFYTQDEIRKVVTYAAERNVTIVPEIEMPGHSQAAIASYPELGNHPDKKLAVWTGWGINPNTLNVEESTVKFYQDVLSEVMELFPSKFIHVGGDEAPKDQWKQSPRMQQRMKELGLKHEDELQSYFIRRMDEFLASNGRRLVGWDEILEGGFAPGATVMSWQGEKGGITAAKAGHDVVMAPMPKVYFDRYQTKDPSREPLAIGGCTTLETVYDYEPVPAELSEQEAKHVLGAQAQLWTEYVPNPRHAEYMVFPRACALAEVVWSGKQKREMSEFVSRLKHHLQRLKLLNVNFRPLDS